MSERTLNPTIYALFGIVLFSLIFYVLESSFLVKSGNVGGALILSSSSLTFALFLIGSALTFVAVKGSIDSKPKWLPFDTFKQQAISFWAGFSLFALIKQFSGVFSVFNFAVLDVSKGFFSQAAEVLGPETFKGVFLNTVVAPITEEAAFFVAIPIFLDYFIQKVAKSYGIDVLSKNFLYRFMIILPLVSYAFASFHIGKVGLTAFFLSAMIFRGIILMFGSDIRKNFIPFIEAGLLFAIGGHMANNIYQVKGSLMEWVNVMVYQGTSNIETFVGIFTIGIIGIMLVTAVYRVIELFEENVL